MDPDICMPAAHDNGGGAGGTGVAPGAPAEPTCGREFLKQTRYFQELLTLHKHGLPLFDTFQLGRTWSRGACVHLQRALPLPMHWAEEVDSGVADFVCELFQVTHLPREQLFLKVNEGGFWLWKRGGQRPRRPSGVLGRRHTHDSTDTGREDSSGIVAQMAGACEGPDRRRNEPGKLGRASPSAR